ncbi:cytochrome P450 [Corallococcus sp. AB049A]|uniref:Cytochrome P450 n=1 Tax=Corallococcus interemptor TaxID=2316720 RepID=A0A3A8Q7N1_9BACT|nr:MULTISPECIES: cytochrome P450 [Corallococcus]RKH49272.1 cytochrome P450 [Corallococcus sp. AB050B]RKH62195.1 cytochrome P450 [Corallococcus interemptor]RKI63229.1 cytochrome P450 [Corallococcus sp. AB049A]
MNGRVNLMAPEVRANPYPVYAELRRSAPVCQVEPGGLWAITRFEDVSAAFKNPQVFSSAGVRTTTAPPWLGHNPFSESMIVMDPPRHMRLRTLVSRAWTPAAVNRLEPRIRSFAQTLAERLSPEREVDFVDAFAMPLPASVIGELFALDPSMTARYKRWSVDLSSVSGTTEKDTHRHESIKATVREMEDYLSQVVAERRRQPQDDMVSDLVKTRVDGEELTDAELMSFLFLLVVAGLETTVQLVSHSVRMLMEQPHLVARLRENPAQVGRFVEEVLRYEPSVHGLVRVTTKETQVAGVTIPEGARVALMVGSACRDGERFKDPDTFDMDREGVNNMPFGHGIHFCLGAPLARLEARVGLEVLLSRFTRFTPTGPVKWNTSLTVRGPLTMPLIPHA